MFEICQFSLLSLVAYAANSISDYICYFIKDDSKLFHRSIYIDIVHQNSLSKIINSFRKHEERENIIYSPFVDDERYIDGWFALHCIWLVEIIILGEINLLSHYRLFVCWCIQKYIIDP